MPSAQTPPTLDIVAPQSVPMKTCRLSLMVNPTFLRAKTARGSEHRAGFGEWTGPRPDRSVFPAGSSCGDRGKGCAREHAAAPAASGDVAGCEVGAPLAGAAYDITKSRFAFGSTPSKDDADGFVRWVGVDDLAGHDVLDSQHVGSPKNNAITARCTGR